MRRAIPFVVSLGLILAACTGGDGSPEVVVAETRVPEVATSGTRVPEVAMSGTRVPGLFLEQFYGDWSRTAALTLGDDGSYELLLDGSEDRGTYRFREGANILRLESVDGDLCEPGDVARLAIETNAGDSGTWLSISTEREDCDSRNDLPSSFLAPIAPASGITGAWTVETSIQFRDDRSYTITSAAGTDRGTYIYRDGIQLLEFETTAGDLCEIGARATVEAEGNGHIDVTEIAFGFGSKDECGDRSRLQAAYHLVSSDS